MRFTIVTPSYNQLDWLRLCIASVRDQLATKAETGNLSSSEGRAGGASEFSIEHIVQDAGTPGIEEFAREMGAEFDQNGKKVSSAQCSVEGKSLDTYLLTIYSGKDAGMYDAINKGLRRASGEICAYLNCDEQYLPGTLRWVADYFLHSPKVEVLFGAAIVTRADGSYVCDRRVMVPTRWHTLVSGNLSIFTSSTFFRRKSVIERGLLFDSQWRVCGDAVWVLQFLKAGLRMESTQRSLSAFAETGTNMSAAANPRAAEEARRLAISAPLVARALKPVVLLDYRLRRWWSGAYALKAHSYAVYAEGDTRQRRRFDVGAPSFRWKMGVGAI
jgi:glycosyltransferase involved in cell wall biosynthesis